MRGSGGSHRGQAGSVGSVKWAPCPTEEREGRKAEILLQEHPKGTERALDTSEQAMPWSQLPKALGATSPGSHSHTGELHPLQTHYPEPEGGPSLAGRGTAALSLSPTFAQVTAGGGTPVALHRRVTAAPSVAVTRTGPGSMLGGAGEEEELLILHGQGTSSTESLPRVTAEQGQPAAPCHSLWMTRDTSCLCEPRAFVTSQVNVPASPGDACSTCRLPSARME